MKIRSFSILAVALTIGVTVSAFSFHNTTWTVNVKDAKISFDLPNGRHNGTVGGLTANFTFEPTHLSLAAIKATVNVNELKADNEKLTAHLMSDDFFAAATHPQISFTSDSVLAVDSGYVAYGKLAMRDSTHNVQIPFTFKQEDKKAVAKGKLVIYSGDYGVGKKSDKGNDMVVVDIEVPVWKE